MAATGAAVAVGIETEVLPGKSRAYGLLGLDGDDGTVPDAEPGTTESGTLRSAARGREVGWTVATPPGAGPTAALPVVVLLHGRDGDHATAFGAGHLAIDRFLAAAVADGVPPFALASVDGGETYWHDRADGDAAGTMVIEEFLPLLGRRGLDVGRVGLVGWSMGGFGALHLGRLLGPERVAAIGAMSPALWHEYDDTAPGAYDDADDFAATTAFGRQDELNGIAVRVDCGEGDPFYAASRDYVDGFAERPAGRFERGDHDVGYWRRVTPAQLAHVGRALAT